MSGLFDLALASELYTELLEQLEPLVKEKRSLLLSPLGALTATPRRREMLIRASGPRSP